MNDTSPSGKKPYSPPADPVVIASTSMAANGGDSQLADGTGYGPGVGTNY